MAMPSQYHEIDVLEAYDLVQTGDPNLIILDVRTYDEYRTTHLIDSISVPIDDLELIMSETGDLANSILLVYCNKGTTSQLACEILIQMGFENVYNILGGIVDWVAESLPVFTTSHHITIDSGYSMDIVPLIAVQSSCDTCTDCSHDDTSVEIDSIVLEEDEDHRIIETTITFEEETSVFLITITRLWSMETITDGVTRSIDLYTTDTIGPDSSTHQYNTLKFTAQHEEYSLSLETILSLSGEDYYNSAVSSIRFKPSQDVGDVSVEVIEFTSEIKLSEMFKGISKAAKKLGEMYDDDGLESLSMNYDRIESELLYLSKTVKTQLTVYDLDIQYSYVVLIDDWWTCWPGCIIPWGILCTMTCAAACVFFPPFCFFEYACLSAGCPAAVILYCEWIGACP
jgi:rhodanese-related sulfurtransferase